MQASAHSPRANPSSTGRATAAGAREIALRDEHVFPALRLGAVAGETSLENILRQIDALMQAPMAPAAPGLDRPQQRDAKQGPEPAASPPQPKPPRKRDLGKAFAVRKAGVGLVAGVALASATLYPTNAHFLTSWIASPLDVEAAPAAFHPGPPASDVSRLAGTSTRPSASIQPSTVPSAAVEATPLAPPPAPPTGSGVTIVAMPPPLPAASAAAPQLEARLMPPSTATSDPPPRPEQAKPDAAPSPSAATPAPQTAALPPTAAKPISAAPAPDHGPSSAPAPTAPNAGSTEPTPAKRADIGNAPVDVLLERGNRLLASGDIVSARQFFERAQAAGVPTAASRIAATYDPLFLRQIGAVGVKADAAQAVEWYRQAATAGDAEAAESLKRLLNESSAAGSRMASSP
ncbi:MAG TPA: hypothetical protein VMA53_06500 [Stellaceae bacterium]|nr:hypothetical protein [Stellaceae bacterium]